jgi:hypothetical protein
VTPFPHDRDPIIGDPRDLGANVEYSISQGGQSLKRFRGTVP